MPNEDAQHGGHRPPLVDQLRSRYHLRNDGSLPRPSGSKLKSPGSLRVRGRGNYSVGSSFSCLRWLYYSTWIRASPTDYLSLSPILMPRIQTKFILRPDNQIQVKRGQETKLNFFLRPSNQFTLCPLCKTYFSQEKKTCKTIYNHNFSKNVLS